jgi:hypothetical protein
LERILAKNGSFDFAQGRLVHPDRLSGGEKANVPFTHVLFIFK